MVKIVIPMAGRGQRFADAGYTEPKPLIEVDGKPMIEHVVGLFPGESDFLFICDETHLVETKMRSVLSGLFANPRIVSVGEADRKGPVRAVARAFDKINDDEEVIVCYCDFGAGWSYLNFLLDTRFRQADGAVVAYKGFHPHMLGTDQYAFLRETDRWMDQIQEKKPYSENRMQDYASNGIYYFKKGQYVKHYFQKLIDQNQPVNGEFYVSLVYNLMKADDLKISVYPLPYMLQWGTPYDLRVYQAWSDYFRDVIVYPGPSVNPPGTTTILPLAGHGSRFATEGYDLPKPLLDVSGFPMVLQAFASVPSSSRHVFVCLNSHINEYRIDEVLIRNVENARVVSIQNVTQGQACTCELGVVNANVDLNQPLMITACDNAAHYDVRKYDQLVKDESVDIIIWSFRGSQAAKTKPTMYSWLDVDENDNVTRAYVKQCPFKDPLKHHVIVGTFFFRKGQYFMDGLKAIYEKKVTTNGEYYVDNLVNELIERKLRVKVFEIKHYVCWGIPDELRTYEYWQRYFHKASSHPYKVFLDQTANPVKHEQLSQVCNQLPGLIRFDRKAVIYHHQGWGDLISCVPIVNFMAQQFKEVHLILRDDAKDMAHYVYDTIPNVKLVFQRKALLDNIVEFLANPDQYFVLAPGFCFSSFNTFPEFRTRFDAGQLKFAASSTYAQQFYFLFGMDLSIRSTYFHLVRQAVAEQKFIRDRNFDLTAPYIVIHDDPERNIVIDRSRLDPKYPVINLNGLTTTAFDALALLEGAHEIHLVDSFWALILYHLYHLNGFMQQTSVWIHTYARPDRDYKVFRNPEVPQWKWL